MNVPNNPPRDRGLELVGTVGIVMLLFVSAGAIGHIIDPEIFQAMVSPHAAWSYRPRPLTPEEIAAVWGVMGGALQFALVLLFGVGTLIGLAKRAGG